MSRVTKKDTSLDVALAREASKLARQKGSDEADAQAQRREKLKALIKESQFGVCRMDVLDCDSRIKWRFANSRPLNVANASSLATGFRIFGQTSFTPNHVMRICVEPNWVKNSLEFPRDIYGLDFKDLQPLEFTEEGINALNRGDIFMHGGNHRRGATNICYQAFKIRTNTAKSSLLALDKDANVDMPTLNTSDMAKAHKWEKLHEEYSRLSVRTEQSKWWGLELYCISKHRITPSPFTC